MGCGSSLSFNRNANDADIDQLDQQNYSRASKAVHHEILHHVPEDSVENGHDSSSDSDDWMYNDDVSAKSLRKVLKKKCFRARKMTPNSEKVEGTATKLQKRSLKELKKSLSQAKQLLKKLEIDSVKCFSESNYQISTQVISSIVILLDGTPLTSSFAGTWPTLAKWGRKDVDGTDYMQAETLITHPNVSNVLMELLSNCVYPNHISNERFLQAHHSFDTLPNEQDSLNCILIKFISLCFRVQVLASFLREQNALPENLIINISSDALIDMKSFISQELTEVGFSMNDISDDWIFNELHQPSERRSLDRVSPTERNVNENIIDRIRKRFIDLASFSESPRDFGPEEIPGHGIGVPGEKAYNIIVGSDIPKIVPISEPSKEWGKLLRQHVRAVCCQKYMPNLLNDAKWEFHSRRTTFLEFFNLLQAAQYSTFDLLAHWPKGDGAGELLDKPIIDDTPVSKRGVKNEWWDAVCSRAAFVPTRCLVTAFVRPISRDDGCALFFFVPLRFRTTPTVFMSHGWNGSVWDMRAPRGSSIWLDILAITQHPTSVGGSVVDQYPDVGDVREVIETIGNTLLIVPGNEEESLLPFQRSWCLFEMVFTPPGALHMHLGWSTWDYKAHLHIRHQLEMLDVSKAQTWSSIDKKQIDEYIINIYGSFFNANKALRSIALQQFADIAKECWAEQNIVKSDAKANDLLFKERGLVPLVDSRVYELWTTHSLERIDTLNKHETRLSPLRLTK